MAGNASSYSGYEITAGQMKVATVSGTSVVAPVYAGLIALINENLVASGGAPAGFSVGFLNPTIYALADSVCRDVTGAAGPPNNNCAVPPGDQGAGSLVTGYPAGVGWDACTGWGSFDGGALLSALQALFQKSMTFITLARVRLNASAGTTNTRAFFRLFQSQSVGVAYQTPPADGSGAVASPLILGGNGRTASRTAKRSPCSGPTRAEPNGSPFPVSLPHAWRI